MISVQNLIKNFGSRCAVNDVTFSAQRGEVLGFLGPNGAGKTTTMRVVTGFLPPTAGTVVVNGFDVREQSVAARRCIGYLPENAPAYADMTVEDFLRFIAEMRGFSGRERNAKADAAIERCFLSSVRRQAIETLSRGYRQRTCFAQAILHDPPVLVLDEPTEGLDPNQKHVVRNMIKQMSAEKVIIFSTHILEEVESVCSRAVIISAGRIVADGTPAELKRQSALCNAVTVTLGAAPDEALAALRQLPGAARVEVLERQPDSARFRVFPKEGSQNTAAVVELVRAKGWRLAAIETEEGRLDEVFRKLTTTADVTADAAGEG